MHRSRRGAFAPTRVRPASEGAPRGRSPDRGWPMLRTRPGARGRVRKPGGYRRSCSERWSSGDCDSGTDKSSLNFEPPNLLRFSCASSQSRNRRILERFYLVFPEPPMDSPPVHQDEHGIALTMYLVVDRNAVSSVRRISVHRSDAATWGTHLARLRVLVSAAGEQEADRDGR